MFLLCKVAKGEPVIFRGVHVDQWESFASCYELKPFELYIQASQEMMKAKGNLAVVPVIDLFVQSMRMLEAQNEDKFEAFSKYKEILAENKILKEILDRIPPPGNELADSKL